MSMRSLLLVSILLLTSCQSDNECAAFMEEVDPIVLPLISLNSQSDITYEDMVVGTKTLRSNIDDDLMELGVNCSLELRYASKEDKAGKLLAELTNLSQRGTEDIPSLIGRDIALSSFRSSVRFTEEAYIAMRKSIDE